MRLQVIPTSFGTVTIAKIPPYVQSRLYIIARYPSIPMEVTTGLGGTEAMPARPGTPDYNRYLEAMEKAEDRRRQLVIAAAIGLGVKKWKIGNGPECSDVPDEWIPPEEYRDIALSSLLEPEPPITAEVLRRADYLLFEIILDTSDLETIISAAVSGVSNADVESAERLFRGQVPGQATSP